jgi:hypothetical protein
MKSPKRAGAEKKTLKEYLFVDEMRLRDIAEQLGVHRATDNVDYVQATIGITNLGANTNRAISFRDTTRSEKIDRVIAELIMHDFVLTERPHSEDALCRGAIRYVLETMTARKVIIPTSQSTIVPGLRDLAIWVADPVEPLDPDKYENNWETEDTFVYLVESYWEESEGPHPGPYSAFSALNFIVSAIAEPLGLPRESYRHDPRADGRSPREVLAAIGGVEQQPREIESLYYLRYISNDQEVAVNGKLCRCYDIVGYPVYIAAL